MDGPCRIDLATGQDPQTVAVIFGNAPPPEFRTAGIKGMVAKLERTDPGLAEEWRERLGESAE